MQFEDPSRHAIERATVLSLLIPAQGAQVGDLLFGGRDAFHDVVRAGRGIRCAFLLNLRTDPRPQIIEEGPAANLNAHRDVGAVGLNDPPISDALKKGGGPGS